MTLLEQPEAGETAASTLARPGFALPGAIPPPERAGRSVAVAPGLHALRLPGRLPGGVYLLRTQAGAHHQVARLICVE